MNNESKFFVKHFAEEDKKKEEEERAIRERPEAVSAAKKKVLALPPDLLQLIDFAPLGSEIKRFLKYRNDLKARHDACEDQAEKIKLYWDFTIPELRSETQEMCDLAAIYKKYGQLKTILSNEKKASDKRMEIAKEIAGRKVNDKIESWRQKKEREEREEREKDKNSKKENGDKDDVGKKDDNKGSKSVDDYPTLF